MKGMRLQSCIDAILEANERVDIGALDPNVIQHFKYLQRVMEEVNAETIREKELVLIEAATNRLLEDMKKFYETKHIEIVHKNTPIN